jgi:flagellar motor component MotA
MAPRTNGPTLYSLDKRLDALDREMTTLKETVQAQAKAIAGWRGLFAGLALVVTLLGLIEALRRVFP